MKYPTVRRAPTPTTEPVAAPAILPAVLGRDTAPSGEAADVAGRGGNVAPTDEVMRGADEEDVIEAAGAQ